MTRPRIGSLFSGYGGLDMGVTAALGGSVAWHVEYDKAPSKILAHHWPEVPNYGDVTAVDWSAVEPVDIITGGSPCQDLSHAGKRQGMTEGTRSNLWVAMREAIAQLRPGLVVWENVRGAYSAAADSEVEPCAGCVGDRPGVSLRALGRVLGDLSGLGYDCRWHGLRAADVGAPHGRFRVFVVAYARGGERGRWGGPRGLGGSAAGAQGEGLQREWARHAARGGRETAPLLPTPAVNDMGEGKTVEAWDEWTAKMQAAHGNGNGHGKSLAIEAQRLSEAQARAGWTEANAPVPEWGWDALPEEEKDAWRGPANRPVASELGGRTYGDDTPGDWVQRLLPTPTSADSKASGAHGYNGNEFCTLTDATVRNPQDWGIYADAIARWEVLTRPAPAPTQPSKKGTPQLSAAFSEWLMGLPAGHVTDVPGLSRNDMLKALGNGVVPQQAEAALRFLLNVQDVAA